MSGKYALSPTLKIPPGLDRIQGKHKSHCISHLHHHPLVLGIPADMLWCWRHPGLRAATAAALKALAESGRSTVLFVDGPEEGQPEAEEEGEQHNLGWRRAVRPVAAPVAVLTWCPALVSIGPAFLRAPRSYQCCTDLDFVLHGGWMRVQVTSSLMKAPQASHQLVVPLPQSRPQAHPGCRLVTTLWQHCWETTGVCGGSGASYIGCVCCGVTCRMALSAVPSGC